MIQLPEQILACMPQLKRMREDACTEMTECSREFHALDQLVRAIEACEEPPPTEWVLQETHGTISTTVTTTPEVKGEVTDAK